MHRPTLPNPRLVALPLAVYRVGASCPVPSSSLADAAANRDAVIAAARVSLVRIALAFGLANAVVPLLIVAASGSATEIAVAAGWVAAWSIAVFNAPRLLALLERPSTRFVLAGTVGAATVASILATGGIDSPLKTGGNWLGWAATVVISPLASMGVAAVFSVAITVAFVLSVPSVADLWSDANRYIVVTGILNPLVIVFVALALAGVFRWVIAAAPGTLWRVRSGGPATSTGLTALFRSEPIALLDAGTTAGDASDPGVDPDAVPDVIPHASTGPSRRGLLTAPEREVVDLLAAGRVPKQIAADLDRSTATIYDRIASAKRKAGARTIEQLVVLTWAPER